MTERDIKRELQQEDNICFFCESQYGQTLCHLIRKSESAKKYKLNKTNCVLACWNCHRIFDDGPIAKRKELRNLDKAMEKIKNIDEMYYNRIFNKWEL